MQEWEYARISWTDSGVELWPGEKFDAQEIEMWLKRSFPQLYQPRLREYPGRLPNLGLTRPRGYRIDRLQHADDDVGGALLQHLGSMGWEAIHIVGGFDGGGAWFKRPIPESAGRARGQAS